MSAPSFSKTPLPLPDIVTLSPLPSDIISLIYSYFLAQNPLESRSQFRYPRRSIRITLRGCMKLWSSTDGTMSISSVKDCGGRRALKKAHPRVLVGCCTRLAELSFQKNKEVFQAK
ncbi:hypothetical protein IAR50_005795 [Cryptococcus sp. DSM 104548]